MTINANITIYHRYVDPDTRLDGFRRYPIYNVLWEENKAANIIASGLESADAVTIYVQIDHMDGAEIDNGDIVIQGLCDTDISQDYTIAQLQQDYRSAVVTSVDRKNFGSRIMQHYVIGGE